MSDNADEPDCFSWEGQLTTTDDVGVSIGANYEPKRLWWLGGQVGSEPPPIAPEFPLLSYVLFWLDDQPIVEATDAAALVAECRRALPASVTEHAAEFFRRVAELAERAALTGACLVWTIDYVELGPAGDKDREAPVTEP